MHPEVVFNVVAKNDHAIAPIRRSLRNWRNAYINTARQYQRHGGRWLPWLVDLSDSVSLDTLEPPIKQRMNPELNN